MGILRRASDAVKRIALGEEDWIEVRSEVSKREFNNIAEHMPISHGKTVEEMSLPEAMTFQSYLFDTLVVAWSLADGKPTLEDYFSLSAEAANAVDAAVAEHFESLVPSSAEGK